MLRSIPQLFGANRPRVIVVVATSPDEAAEALSKASPHVTGEFPKWCVCPGLEGETLAGFDRVLGHRSVRAVWNELRSVWPALMIVFWTGHRKHHLLKALPFLIPPFRMLFFNEAARFPAGTRSSSTCCDGCGKTWITDMRGPWQCMPEFIMPGNGWARGPGFSGGDSSIRQNGSGLQRNVFSVGRRPEQSGVGLR